MSVPSARPDNPSRSWFDGVNATVPAHVPGGSLTIVLLPLNEYNTCTNSSCEKAGPTSTAVRKGVLVSDVGMSRQPAAAKDNVHAAVMRRDLKNMRDSTVEIGVGCAEPRSGRRRYSWLSRAPPSKIDRKSV